MTAVLVIGNGGREHTIAWRIQQSSKVGKVLVSPGNGGTQSAQGKIANLPLDVTNHAEVVAACQEHKVDLVIVGPEIPLAAGLGDALRGSGILCFGPNKDAAEIEASKAFSKDFMARWKIPTAAYANFTDYEAAVKYVESVDHQVVIKASGLAAGKGVLMPTSKAEALEALRSLMVDKSFGSAGGEVVVEEFMEGEEASILAFVDGFSVLCCPAAQDHKRIGEGDTGLNTGGMGAYCPAPAVTTAVARRIEREIVQPCVDGLRKEGMPFMGCLFTGIMLTKTGPKCVEYNCRFGDPETQAVLALLDEENGADLYEIMRACARGCLDSVKVCFRPEHAATVVMASQGYPEKYPKGKVITGTETVTDATVFHAGTSLKDGQLMTSGGRVLAVTGVGADLKQALGRAYAGIDKIKFEGAQFRRDIGHRALAAKKKLRLGVLGSTRGTDMQAVVQAIQDGTCNASIEVVVSDRSKSGILDKARKYDIPWYHIGGAKKTRPQYDALVTEKLKEHRVDLVLLIGFMRIVSAEFCQEWKNQLLNVHPSLLPKFAGGMDCDVHQAVLEAKETETGCTVHWVTEEVDSGGIAVQKRCDVAPDDTPASLKAKVQALEGQAFLEAIAAFADGTIVGKSQ